MLDVVSSFLLMIRWGAVTAAVLRVSEGQRRCRGCHATHSRLLRICVRFRVEDRRLRGHAQSCDVFDEVRVICEASSSTELCVCEDLLLLMVRGSLTSLATGHGQEKILFNQLLPCAYTALLVLLLIRIRVVYPISWPVSRLVVYLIVRRHFN